MNEIVSGIHGNFILLKECYYMTFGGGYGFGSGFALIVVLFILLIIIGCSCYGGYGGAAV
jgi:uncharacterized protein (TIGR01732 family)